MTRTVAAMASPRYPTLDLYLADLSPVAAGSMQAMIDCVLGQFPQLSLKMAWNVPQLHLGKQYVMGFSAAKRHLSVSPWSTDVMRHFADRLQAFDPTDNLFRVPLDWQPDAELLHDLVKARLAETV